jgi:magnesium-transporting ATPase (P-type)
MSAHDIAPPKLQIQQASSGGSMNGSQSRFISLAAKTIVSHTLTYFVMGAFAYNVFHYADTMNQPESGMRSTTNTIIYFGPALQIFRGLLFATVFYPFRDKLFGRKHGWLLMAWMLIGLGILGTFAAPAGSFEGFIFTTTPVLIQVRSYIEIGTQALLLSVLLCYWVNHPRRWLSWLLGVAYVICIALPVLGLAAQHAPKAP